MNDKKIILSIGVIIGIVGLVYLSSTKASTNKISSTANPSVAHEVGKGTIISGKFDSTKFKTDQEWKKILTAKQYTILREEGTEIPYTGELTEEKRKGTYYSAGCNEPVFRSEQKFDSGTGWPSFWDPIKSDALVLRQDTSVPGEPRIEVLDKCGNHLGHVFDDGPLPTGKRYCMNSEALTFKPDKE